MAHNLTFSVLHSYNSGEPGISLPVRLSNGAGVVELIAKIDTGSSYCIFQKDYGERLGIDIETGTEVEITTANSSFIAYAHEVSLLALGFEFHAVVYFAKEPDIRRNVLGRQGWLDRIRLGLIDYDGKIYMSDYNDDFDSA